MRWQLLDEHLPCKKGWLKGGGLLIYLIIRKMKHAVLDMELE